MGARGLAALVVLLLAAALLPNTASGSDRRILEGGKPSSGEVRNLVMQSKLLAC